jgi:hypothetical protein
LLIQLLLVTSFLASIEYQLSLTFGQFFDGLHKRQQGRFICDIVATFASTNAANHTVSSCTWGAGSIGRTYAVTQPLERRLQ